jgi:hypothetical protein
VAQNNYLTYFANFLLPNELCNVNLLKKMVILLTFGFKNHIVFVDIEIILQLLLFRAVSGVPISKLGCTCSSSERLLSLQDVDPAKFPSGLACTNLGGICFKFRIIS